MESTSGPNFNYSSGDPNTKKRSYSEFMLSQQLMHRFKAKADFLAYFNEACKYPILHANLNHSVALRPSGNHGQ